MLEDLAGRNPASRLRSKTSREVHPSPFGRGDTAPYFRCMLLATLLVLASFADTHIHGVVRDSASRAPLHGAVVRMMEVGRTSSVPGATNKGAVTDRTGSFHVHDVEGDSVQLRVSFIGYATALVPLRLKGDEHELHVEILLAPSSVRGADVVVSAERAASAALPTQQARVLSEAEIDEHRGQTFADALTQVPGVTLVQTGPGIKKPMINGMMGTRLILRNNDLVQEGQQWGIEHAPEIDAMSPSSITVVKGPSAIKFGPNALGGVVDIATRPIRKDPGLHGEATMNLFSNGRQGALGAFVESGSVGSLPIALRAQASARMGGDAAAPNYMINNSGVRELNASLCAETGDVERGLRILGSLFSTTLGIFKGAHIGNASDMLRAIERGRPTSDAPFSYDITNPRQEVSHALLSLRAFTRLSPTEKLSITTGYQLNDRSEFDAHNVRIVGRGTDPFARAADSLARLKQALASPAMNLLLGTASLDAELEHALTDDIRGSV
ncbi:MAG: TonB-dependent receptor plug domain-containing protein, partial [Candidatus Kapaibacterium sp.]